MSLPTGVAAAPALSIPSLGGVSLLLLQSPLPSRSRIFEYLSVVSTRVWLALFVLLLGLVFGYLVGVVNRRLLERAGVPAVIEGTAFERTAREFGTSTVSLVVKLTSYFVVGLAVVVALTVAEIQYVELFWSDAATFVPRLFVAVFVLIVGVVVGDKVELYATERLRGIKVPEIGIIPTAAKYSIVYVSALIALDQIGVATLALIVLLAAYAFALVLLTALATKDLLASAAAGVYLLLNQPYSIGDEVEIDGKRGVVQEVDLFVTHVETDSAEHVFPNRVVFRSGIARVRG